MSSLWSAVGGAVAGAGSGAAQLANQYVDEEIQMQKAQVLADIAHANAVKMDKYNLSPERQSLLTNAEANRERAVGAARNETTLAGDVARAKNPELRQARIDDTNEIARGTTQTRIDVENAIVTGTASAKIKAEAERAAALLPIEIKRAYALADAAGSASERHRDAPGAELQAKLAIVAKTLGRELTEQEKLGLLGLSKVGPETDKVTTKVTSPDGLMETTRESKVPRGGGASEGPPEGSVIYDKQTGEKFVVKNGVPAPAEKPAQLTKSEAGAMRSAERAAGDAATAPKRRDAAEVFAKINGDPFAAAALQKSELFDYLAPDQKAAVFKTVNGR